MSVVTSRRCASSSQISGDQQRGSFELRTESIKPRLSRQLHHPHVTLVEYKLARFLITDQPNTVNIESFITVCRLHRVGVLVRVCERSYMPDALEAAGIRVVDLEFDDGAPPPESVIRSWFQIITDLRDTQPDACVAVHCRAGLGRAPTLVAAALIALGMPYDEAVEMIRSLRSGALNARQIQYLKNFRPPQRLRLKSHPDRCCLL